MVSEGSPLNDRNPGLVVILNEWDRPVGRFEVAQGYLPVQEKEAADDSEARTAVQRLSKHWRYRGLEEVKPIHSFASSKGSLSMQL